VLPSLILVGIGCGLTVAPSFATATFGVPARDSGVASTMVNVSQQVGGSIGTALLNALAASAATYLPDHPHAAVAEAVGDPKLPQRAVALERPRHHRVGQLVQVAGARFVDVLGDVEGLVIDPDRVRQPERHLGEPLAIARRAREPARHVVAQSSKRGARVPSGRPNAAAQPTCMCAVGVSTSRNEASSALRRLRDMTPSETQISTLLAESHFFLA
jgi:hypothetical protein